MKCIKLTVSRLFHFRVYDKENKQMVYPDGNGYFKLKYDTIITGDGDLFDLVNQEIVENCILMQETIVEKDAVLDNVIADKNSVISEKMVLKGTTEHHCFVRKSQIV